MRFRLRLALAFILLSALPLTLLAVYSYTRSSAALRRAIEAEAELTAGELENRLGVAAGDLNQKVRALARLPTDYWLRPDSTAHETDGSSADGQQVFARVAEVLPFIDGFKFVPAPDSGKDGENTKHWLWAEPSEAEKTAQAKVVETALRSAEASLRLTAGSFGPGLPEEERERIVVELAKVREQIRATITARHDAGTRAYAFAVAGGDGAARSASRSRISRDRAEDGTPGETRVKRNGSAAAEIACPIENNGEVVGEIQGTVKAKEILRTVLGKTKREEGEVPFAIDESNQLIVARDEDGETLRSLPGIRALRGAAGAPDDVVLSEAADGDADRQWIVVSRKDDATGFRLGIARPISRAMKELKNETALNFLAAFFLIGLTSVGMIPLTAGMVRKVHALEAGATRIASGDLTTRVAIRSRDEFGRLASTFNRMAEQLSANQEKLLEQERVQKEREIERRLLAAENDRKSQELEDARQFQLSLLPGTLPERRDLELAVAMSTATEVGGDYYDVREVRRGAGAGANSVDLIFAIGDATGHGAAAGTMVTVVKSVFMAAPGDEGPAEFLRRSTALVHGMGLSRMAMALAVARLSGSTLRYSSAGMPPALHFRAASGAVEEIALAGMPLGARADFPYLERAVELAPGDTLLMMSDGFPELTNAADELLGYERARAIFTAVAASSPREIVAALERAARDWSGASAPSDDVTFLVLRKR